ncbi:hypothetical protein JCM16303_006518 [Sporobolomyces ruberrimus]
MVAAPETQQQQPDVPAQDPTALKQMKFGKDSSDEGKQPVNGFAVVDGSSPSPDANDSARSGSPTHNLPPPDVARNIPCRFFPLGTCKYGEQCIFSHGIPGVAGSPGVPASPSVQQQNAPGHGQGSAEVSHSNPIRANQAQQQAYPHLQPQQHQMMDGQAVHSPPVMEQAYMQGMPMYYPHEQGLQYGFQPPFSPEQGYYHFAPPPFQAYPQHYQQFAYYPPPPPPPPVAAQLGMAVPPSQPPPVALDIPALVPSPTPSPSHAVDAAFTPSAEQHDPETSVSPPNRDSTAQSPSQAVGPDGATLPRAPASLHTFFQTSASTPSGSSLGMPPSTSSPLPTTANPPVPPAASTSPNGFVKALPGRLNGPRRSIGGLAPGTYPQGPNVGAAGKPRRSFGGSRPPCSFFEANRCKNGDECSFVHMLADGTDARALGRGMIGSDGRTDSPEATGGTPPAWLINQKALRFSGAHGNGGAGAGMKKHYEGGMQMMNGVGLAAGAGGYPYRDRGNALQQGRGLGPRGRYEDEQNARFAQGHHATASSMQPSDGQAHAQPGLLAQAQVGTQRPALADVPLAGRIPPGGGGTPQLVAAINGLTRRIPPAHLQQQSVSTLPTPSADPQPVPSRSRETSQQRVPTVNDFPALGSPAAPLSPAVEKDSYTNAAEAVPVIEQHEGAANKEDPDAPLATAEVDGFVMVSHDDASPPSTSTSTSPTTVVSAAEVSLESDLPPASAPSSSPVNPTPPTVSPTNGTRAGLPPKFTMSFASIAKAASASSAPPPEKTKPQSAIATSSKAPVEAKTALESPKPEAKTSTKVATDVEQNDGFVTKTSKKKSKKSTPVAQVSIKA